MNVFASPVLTFLRAAVPMWVGTIFVAAGTIGFVATVAEWRAEQRFRRDAVAVEGRVVATSLEAADSRGNSRTRYLVTYRFAGLDGASVERTEEVSVEEWEEMGEGAPIIVRFSPGDPTSARTRADDPTWVQPLVVGALALVALIGIVIALPYWRRAFVLVRLHRSGVRSRATIVEVAPSGVSINRVPQWHVRYEYRDSNGGRQSGTSDLLSPAEAAEWAVGAHGAIRYDRERPSDSVWLGRS